MNDITTARIRRRLQTIRLPIPRPEVIEEIVDWIDQSDTYVSVTESQHLVDEAIQEATNSDLDAEHYDRGYRQALDDITELGGGESAADSGPTAA